MFHRHGDRTPLQNYFKGSEREEEENAIWKETVIVENRIHCRFQIGTRSILCIICTNIRM